MPSAPDASPAWFRGLASSSALDPLLASVEAGGASSCRGASGSSTTFLAAAIAARTGRPVLLVVAHLDEAEEAAAELGDLADAGLCPRPAYLPALEAAATDGAAGADLLGERLAVARRLHAGDAPPVMVAALPALMQSMPESARIPGLLLDVRAGTRCPPRDLAAWLAAAGYVRTEAIENPGEFAVRGGVMDVFPPGGALPVRLDFFGDDVERIFEVDLATQASDRTVDAVQLVAASVDPAVLETAVPVGTLLDPRTVVVVAEVAEVMEQGRGYWERVADATGIVSPQEVFKAAGARCHAVVDVNGFSAANASNRVANLPVENLPAFEEEVGAAFRALGGLAAGCACWLCCDSDGELARARELLAEHVPGAPVHAVRGHVHRGFRWSPAGAAPIAVVPQREVLHRFGTRRRVQRVGGTSTRDAFLQFGPGDYVVHRDHGIARFHGLHLIAGQSAEQGEEEFLTLEFDAGARLHVPASKIDLVQKYVGAGSARPPLSALGGKRWKAQKERVQEAVRDLAGEMLRIQAAREASAGIRYPEDTAWMREFEADFPWTETEDQVAAIAAVKRERLSMRNG